MNNRKTKDELLSNCNEQNMKRYTGKKTDYTIRNIKENMSKYAMLNVKDEIIPDIYNTDLLKKQHTSNL